MGITIEFLSRVWLRRSKMGLLAVLLAVPLISSARGTGTTVDLQLVLAIDVSNSVTDDRFELQKQGYADAFRNPQVLKAILSGSEQSVAVTMVQWTGPTDQVQVCLLYTSDAADE